MRSHSWERYRAAVRRGAVGVSVLLAAMPAMAAEEGGEATFLGLPVVLWKTLNMLLFFGLLFYLLAKPLSRFFVARRDEIVHQLEEARRQREEAERMKAEMEARVASLESEILALQKRLHEEGQRELEALERQGDEEAARILRQVSQEADRRVEEARRSLAGEAARLASEMAYELLRRELTPEDRERIFRDTLDRLEAQTQGGRR